MAYEHLKLATNMKNPQVGSLIGIRHYRGIVCPAIYNGKGSVCMLTGALCTVDRSKLVLLKSYPPFQIGSSVVCIQPMFSTWPMNVSKRVDDTYLGIDGIWVIVVHNKVYGSSSYRVKPGIFESVEQSLTPNKEEESEMSLSYLAIRRDYLDMSVADDVRKSTTEGSLQFFAADSFKALKDLVTARIKDRPDEVWVIYTATTQAEIATPPVRFMDLRS